jgi:hypothetical protein
MGPMFRTPIFQLHGQTPVELFLPIHVFGNDSKTGRCHNHLAQFILKTILSDKKNEKPIHFK